MTSIEAKPAADGILPVQELDACFKKGFISSATELSKDQVQPASLDLRLGRRAWRIQASFLPGMNQTVQDKIEKLLWNHVSKMYTILKKNEQFAFSDLLQSL